MKFDENYFKVSNQKKATEIKDLLTEDEQILWKGKPKKSAFIASRILSMLPIALIWLLFDGSFITILIIAGVGKQLPAFAIIFLVVFFLFHLAPVWIWLSNIITANREHKHMEYAFTNTRIIIKSGVIGIDINNIYYADIQSVNLKVGMIDKILKVGDIYISGSFKSQVLWDVENPYFMVSKLQKIIGDIKSDVYFPNAYRPEENNGYNTKYKI